MQGLFLGLSALRSSQVGLQTAAHNIANADTPGYHRQRVDFRQRAPWQRQHLHLGTGVEATQIYRLRQQVVAEAFTENVSALHATQSHLEMLRRVEALWTPASGSIHDRLQKFFDTAEQLHTHPDDSALRSIFLRSGQALADSIRSLDRQMTQLRHGIEKEIADSVQQINRYAEQISELTKQVRVSRAMGREPNDLLDRRDQLVNELAELTDVRVMQQGNHQEVVLLAGESLLIGEKPVRLETAIDKNGEIVVRQPGRDDQVVSFSGGRLAGLLDAHRQIKEEFQAPLNTFTQSLMAAVDHIHAQGVGGSQSEWTSLRTVKDTTVPLVEAGLQLPMSAGMLQVTVTELATGERRATSLAIDPAADSLNDVAAMISGVDHLQAVADSKAGTITLMAASGYTFDFTGQADLDLSNVTGSSVPQIAGHYTGGGDHWTFTVVDSGTVAVTEGLAIEVHDSSGQLVAMLDAGAGYEPDSLLALGDGLQLRVGPGSLAASDEFSIPLTSNADTTGLLAALGLGSFFTGSGSHDIQLNPRLQQDPEYLAVGKSGASGDNRNLQQLLQLRDQPIVGDGQTAEEFMNHRAVAIGDRVRDADFVEQNLQGLLQRTVAEREALSGVDPDEELVHMLRFQRAYQAAARVISTFDQNFEELLRMAR